MNRRRYCEGLAELEAILSYFAGKASKLQAEVAAPGTIGESAEAPWFDELLGQTTQLRGQIQSRQSFHRSLSRLQVPNGERR